MDGMLYIKRRDADGNERLFPNDGEPAVLGTYTYNAKRMGGAPTITDSFSYGRCLDKEWTKEEFVTYDGEDYYVSSLPSSTIDNSSGRYKHEITLVSRREVLDNTLFFDVVTDDAASQDKDRYRSNLPKFSFGGDVYEFVKRINSSLSYCGLYNPKGVSDTERGYYVVVDEGYGSDEVKELSFDGKYITEVLQEIYNTYGLSYYWVGKVCHVGDVQNDLTEDPSATVRYGRDDALLSLSNNNSNAKVIDMITGYGSSDNIPYYYPNEDEYGEAVFDVANAPKESVSVLFSGLWRWNTDCFGKPIYLCNMTGGIADVRTALSYSDVELPISKDENFEYGVRSYDETGGYTTIRRKYAFDKENGPDGGKYYSSIEDKIAFSIRVKGSFKSNIDLSGFIVSGLLSTIDGKQSGVNDSTWLGDVTWETTDFYVDSIKIISSDGSDKPTILKKDRYSNLSDYDFVLDEDYIITYTVGVKFRIFDASGRRFDSGKTLSARYKLTFGGEITYRKVPEYEYYFKSGDLLCGYENSGIKVADIATAPSSKAKYVFGGKARWWYAQTLGGEDVALCVTVRDRIWIAPTSVLMPSIYRKSKGAERFYYATDGVHKNPDGGFYTFKNQYTEGNPHQGVVTFDDIKPTIRGIRNDVIQEDGKGQLFGEIADVAFDSLDSDVKGSEGKFEHQYFYVKLHKFSGEFGFDLFSHALASESAKIDMTDCQGCPACSFPIVCIWDSGRCYNPVSVDSNGNLLPLRTSSNDYILSDAEAKRDKFNQNSQEREIWIALQKETSTLGIVMPNAAAGFRPKAGDKFVITGINPPHVLTDAAEKRLDEALISHMSENNEDKFNKTIKFSRVFLAENPGFATRLNENTKLNVEYNGDISPVYVNDYTVKRDGNILSEVSVEVVNSLEITQSSMKQTIDAVKGETIRSLGSLLTSDSGFNAAVADKMYLSKIKADIAQELIRFLKGIAVGDGTHGIDGNGVAILKQILSKEFDDAVAEGALGEGFFLGQRKDSDGNGYSYLEVDRMLVRKVAEFVKLVVTELRSVGGTIVLSPASMVCTKVEQRLNNGALVSPGEGSMPDFYRCYFRSEEDGREINNEFEVGDMARCQTFNIKTGTTANAKNRYYWRKVVAVGADYIDLSPTDCDRSAANDIPAQGDEIVAMGNASDTSRQAVITLSAYGANAPSIVIYRGVNSYSLSGKEVTVLSKKEVYILADRLYYRAADGTAKSVSEALKQAAEGMTAITKRVTTLEVTSDSITARVTKTEKTVKAQGDELAGMGTKIEQTAEGISLAVSRQTSGRENLLTGSALRRDDSYMARLVGDTQIRCNGYGGTNFLRLTDTYDGTARHYYGMQWGNTTNTAYAPNVAVKKGRHTVAVMARSSVKGKGILKVEAYLHAERWDAVRLANDTTTVRRWSGTFALDAADTWEMKTLDVDVTEEGRFMEVYVFLYCAEQGVTYTLDVCRPMLCEADFYVWSQSVADYAYTGGNMLAGSRSLAASNLAVKGAVAAGGYGSAASVTNAYSGAQTDTLTWSGIRLEANTDYTLSFMAKGNGTMACYLHNGSAASVKYAENSQGLTVGAGWGAVTVKPSTEWQRYWVHFRTADTTTLDFYCIIGRLTATDALVTIAEPKLEKGATATEWTDLAADLIEEGSVETRLLESGIDIRNRRITAKADTFEIRNNAGTLTASVNKDGVLETTDAVLGGTLRAKDGYFSGFVKKSLCPVTPDSIGTLGTIDTSTGYVTLDFTKTGSMMVLMGDLKSKIGQHNELTLMLKYGTTGGSSAEAFFYLDQKIVILNNSNVTVGIPAAAAGTVTPSGTPTIDGGYMMVLEPVVDITVNSGISTATYAMRWNVKRAKM